MCEAAGRMRGSKRGTEREKSFAAVVTSESEAPSRQHLHLDSGRVHDQPATPTAQTATRR